MRLARLRSLVSLASLAPLALATAAPAFLGFPSSALAAGEISIPFTKTTLPNGLTVILSEDHTLPLVAVNVGYRVCSPVEEPHRAGFAQKDLDRYRNAS